MSVSTIQQSLKKYGSLAKKNPLLATELHKDNDLTAKEIPITYGRQKIFKWKCHKCGHIRFAAVDTRHLGYNKITKCPNKKCKNYRWNYLKLRNVDLQIQKDGSFAKNHPELLKEWDYKKNKKDPSEYSRGSSQKVWWICKNNHSWKASIGSRTRKEKFGGGSNCKKCQGRGVSKLELRIYSELKYVFKNVVYHKYIDGLEIDMFLTNYNLGVEVDGYMHHKSKTLKFDLIKNQKLKKQNIKLIRIRDHRLPKISNYDVLLKSGSAANVNDIKRLILSILKVIVLSKKDKQAVKKYLGFKKFPAQKNYKNLIKELPDYSGSKFSAESYYNKLSSQLPSPPYKMSLEYLHPDLSKEWDYKMNNPFKPSMVTPGSNAKFWWICFNGHKPWEARVYRRVKGTGCKKCGFKISTEKLIENKIKKHGILKDKYPDLTKLFMEKKNKITVDKVHCGSGPNYWWHCKKHNFKWQSRVDKIIERKFPCRLCSDENRPKRKKYKI